MKLKLYSTFIILFLFFSSYSQNDTVSLKEVEIQSSRIPQVYSESSRMLTIIPKEEIKSLPSQSIEDILELIPSADIRQRGSMGVQADISFRGSTFDQVLILLNGVNINDPQTGHHSMNLPVNIEQIERIEILHGPGARIYGANSFSGAINIITKAVKEKTIQTGITGGEYGYFKGHGAINFFKENYNGCFSVSKENSDGYTNNTDFEKFSLLTQNEITINKNKLMLTGGFNNKAFGANSFYSQKYPDQFEQTRTLFSSLVLKTNNSINFTPSFYWRMHQDRFELYRNDAPVWYTSHNYHLTNILGFSFNSQFLSKLGKTAFGGDYRVEDIKSNVLGDALNDTLDVPFEPEGFFTKSKERNYVSVFFEHLYSLKKFSVSFGTLLNWNNDYNWNLYPGIDFSYNFSKRFKYFASVNKSLRLPTFTDLYYQGPTNKGNPNLKPEEALTIESGIKHISKKFNSSLAVFKRNGKNTIDWARLSDTLLWQTMNITELQAYGLEFSGSLSFNHSNKISINSINFGYTFIETEKYSGEYISKYVLDYLKHKAVFGINLNIIKNFSSNFQFRLEDRAGTYTEYSTGNEIKYKPVFLSDVKVKWEKPNYQIFISVTNLTNSEYFEYSNVPMPGRWANAGFSLKFNY